MAGRTRQKEEAKTLGRILGARMREARRAKGWTQAIISEKLGFSPDGYARLERGTNLPSLLTLMKICELIEVSPNWLLQTQYSPPTQREESHQRLCESLRELDQNLLTALELISQNLAKLS